VHSRKYAGAGLAQSVQCLTTGWTAGVRSPTEAEDFSSTLCVQTGSGAHPASRTVGTGGSFRGGKGRPGRDADHSPPSSAEVKKEQELCLLSPRCASMERNGTTLPFYQKICTFVSKIYSNFSEYRYGFKVCFISKYLDFAAFSKDFLAPVM
jgi:hypothetical protein